MRTCCRATHPRFGPGRAASRPQDAAGRCSDESSRSGTVPPGGESSSQSGPSGHRPDLRRPHNRPCGFDHEKGSRAEAGGIALSTPAGLSPGESFRFIFVTDGTTQATSTDIAYYNNFVNAQAGGATYNGSVVTWDAIASTPTVNAIDNVGQTLTPVYLANGLLATTSTTELGLWTDGPSPYPFDVDLNGNYRFVRTWTGSLPGGYSNPLYALGDSTAVFGYSYNNLWLASGAAATTTLSLYGVSQVLIATAAVPEPSTLLMAGTAAFAGCAFFLSRRRRDQRRQRPAGNPDATE